MKSKFVILTSLVAVGTILASFRYSEGVAEESPTIAYPTGYRNWTHVKTYIVGPKSLAFKFIGGFNHVYANERALQGYKSGHFYNGSVIVSDVIEAKEDSVDIREGRRHHLDVMARDSIKYADSGGWAFEEFSGDSETRILTQMTTTICSNCHAKKEGYVYSDYRK
jgi:hypothetical protein